MHSQLKVLKYKNIIAVTVAFEARQLKPDGRKTQTSIIYQKILYTQNIVLSNIISIYTQLSTK